MLIVGVDSNSLIVASRTPVWQVRGEGGYGIQPPEELLRVVGGYDTAADKGTIPYPTGQISGTLGCDSIAHERWLVDRTVPTS